MYMELSVDRYLARIGVEREPFLTYDYLQTLQLKHQMSIPYETMDIVNRVPFTLKIEDIYDKIVNRGRGGYCFELNGLFGWLLRQLGFTVTDHFARFLRGSTEIPMRRHRVLRVQCEGREYIADVGVGSRCPAYPLLLAEGVEQKSGEEVYCFERNDILGWVCTEKHKGVWEPYYSFTTEPSFDVDFEVANFYCQNSPDSMFINNPMASIRTEDGRRTLANREFRIFTENGTETYTPSTRSEFYRALRIYFGIRI